MMRFPGRLLILCGFFGIWIFLCIVCLFRYTVLQRDSLREKSKKISWRTGSVPVLRGRILDKNGIPLAWTEIQYEAVLERFPRSGSQKQLLLNRLKNERKIDISASQKVPFLLKRGLSPEEMEYFTRLSPLFPGIILRTRILRKNAEGLSLRNIPGKCRTEESGIQRGISGKEKEFDSALSGEPGRFRVMLDRHGNWIPETLRIEKQGVPGKDVWLRESTDELICTGKEGQNEPE